MFVTTHELLWREIRESYAAIIRFQPEDEAIIRAAEARENHLFRSVPASAKAILDSRTARFASTSSRKATRSG
ncbi:hypothetical protein EJB05_02213, partial [Eragrostis curvula]